MESIRFAGLKLFFPKYVFSIYGSNTDMERTLSMAGKVPLLV